MKICHISLHFAEYGYRLAMACAERHDVLFIVNRRGFLNEMGDAPISSRSGRLRVVQIADYKLRDPRMLFSAFRIWNEIRKFRPDIIHCQEAYRDYLMMALPFLRPCPLVLTVHDHVPHSGRDAAFIAKHRFGRYRVSLRRRAKAVIVHGEWIREETIPLMPWLQGCVFAVPHGVLGEPDNQMRASWVPGRLLFFGRVEEYKGLGNFLDALDILQGEGLSVHGVIAGRGDDLNNHRARIAASSHCTLIERHILPSEIPRLFHEANVVVLPYTDATQSGVAAYALRYGRPVVATSVGALPEVVRHGINGLIIEPRNARALASAIRVLVTNPERAAGMAAEAMRLAGTEFSWEAIAQRTDEVYQEVLNDRQDPA